eukprot:00796_3
MPPLPLHSEPLHHLILFASDIVTIEVFDRPPPSCLILWFGPCIATNQLVAIDGIHTRVLVSQPIAWFADLDFYCPVHATVHIQSIKIRDLTIPVVLIRRLQFLRCAKNSIFDAIVCITDFLFLNSFKPPNRFVSAVNGL